MMKKRKQRWNSGLQTSPEMNQILNNHADWLDYNVSKVAGNECRRQAIAFVKVLRERRDWSSEKIIPIVRRFHLLRSSSMSIF